MSWCDSTVAEMQAPNPINRSPRGTDLLDRSGFRRLCNVPPPIATVELGEHVNCAILHLLLLLCTPRAPSIFHRLTAKNVRTIRHPHGSCCRIGENDPVV